MHLPKASRTTKLVAEARMTPNTGRDGKGSAVHESKPLDLLLPSTCAIVTFRTRTRPERGFTHAHQLLDE